MSAFGGKADIRNRNLSNYRTLIPTSCRNGSVIMTHHMGQTVKLESVQLIVVKPFRLDDDPEILLSPGTYPGQRRQIGMATLGGVSWTKPDYRLELSVGQQKAMSGKRTRIIAIEYDVTDHVRRGELQVAN